MAQLDISPVDRFKLKVWDATLEFWWSDLRLAFAFAKIECIVRSGRKFKICGLVCSFCSRFLVDPMNSASSVGEAQDEKLFINFHLSLRVGVLGRGTRV